MAKKLTIEMLQNMPAGKVFAQGTARNKEGELWMTDVFPNRRLIWVAARGGTDDWAIYTHWESLGADHARKSGDKVINKEIIQKLVPCTAEALARYRY
jgi:hypothetical protein